MFANIEPRKLGLRLAVPRLVMTDRPRERLLRHGADRLTTPELLGLILGSGVRGYPAAEVGASLLQVAGGLRGLWRAPPRELVHVTGIGQARAARLAAAFAVARRAMEDNPGDEAPVGGPEDIYRRLRPRLEGLSQEVFVVLALDVRGMVLDEIEVFRGCLTGVEVHPREVFRPLIRQSAAAAVVAHNHPSGDPTPSEHDLILTRRLREVGELVGIPILDHVVFGTHQYRSILEILSC